VKGFDAIRLEVLRNALEATAQEMGSVLKHTAFSPNIKERMDASCAIFTAGADLVAQAEHVPVHLGSMLRAVGPTLERTGPLQAGDVVIVNDPYVGGAHLPDITLIAAVFVAGRRIAHVAARAHHSDVGGMEPGSMPGRSVEIFQEGLVIPPVRLYRAGVLQEDVLDFVLANVRTPAERRGDLNAQLAALRIGERRLEELAARFGADLLAEGLDAILDYTERRMRARLAELPRGVWLAEDCLDSDGSSDEPVRIRLRIELTDSTMHFDFSGSSPQVRGNVNAVAPMCWSAIFYALKLLTDASLPPNAGVLRPVTVHIPPGSFLDAQPPAAVCAGNTETTQRLADTILRGFAQIAPDRIAAASNGTMNLIGIGGTDPRSGRAYTYIETSGGGQGGRPMGPGMSGVHANMSNTLNTPIESLEISYPLRCTRYELREGSGGDGLHPGGDGIVRAIRIVGHNARVSLQTDRRRFPPYGLGGGEDGRTGRNLIVGRDGTERPGPTKGSFTLGDGDSVVLETPGGGGWGPRDQTADRVTPPQQPEADQPPDPKPNREGYQS
jgi:N-methylhydantoinase B